MSCPQAARSAASKSQWLQGVTGPVQSNPAACAGLTLVNMVWFWYVANAYRYKDVKHAQKRYVGGTSLKPPRGPVPPWARAREVTIPAGHRRAVSAPLLL